MKSNAALLLSLALITTEQKAVQAKRMASFTKQNITHLSEDAYGDNDNDGQGENEWHEEDEADIVMSPEPKKKKPKKRRGKLSKRLVSMFNGDSSGSGGSNKPQRKPRRRKAPKQKAEKVQVVGPPGSISPSPPSSDNLAAIGKETSWIYKPVYRGDKIWDYGGAAQLQNDALLREHVLKHFGGLQNQAAPTFFLHGSTTDPRLVPPCTSGSASTDQLWTVAIVHPKQDLYWPTTCATKKYFKDHFGGDELHESNLTEVSPIGFVSVWQREKSCNFTKGTFRPNPESLDERNMKKGKDWVYARMKYKLTKTATHRFQWPDAYVFTVEAFHVCGMKLVHVYVLKTVGSDQIVLHS